MIDRDIWITANEMIKQFGDDAETISATRADALPHQGDEEGYAVWKRVVRAIPRAIHNRVGLVTRKS